MHDSFAVVYKDKPDADSVSAQVSSLATSVDVVTWQRLYRLASLFLSQNGNDLAGNSILNSFGDGLSSALEHLKSTTNIDDKIGVMRINEINLLLARLGRGPEDRCLELCMNPSVDMATRLASAQVLAQISSNNSVESLVKILSLPHSVVTMYSASVLAINGRQSGMAYLANAMRRDPRPPGWLSVVILLTGLGYSEAATVFEAALGCDGSEEFSKNIVWHIDNLVAMHAGVRNNLVRFYEIARSRTDSSMPSLDAPPI